MQNILLAQDLQPIPAAMRDVLALEYEVHIALDGMQVLGMVKKKQVVVVVLADIHRPDRLALLRELIVREYKVLAVIEPQRALPSLSAENVTDAEEKSQVEALQMLLGEKKQALIRACVALGAHGILEWGADCEANREAIGDTDGNVLLFKIATVCTGERTYPMTQLAESLAYYVKNLPAMNRSSMAILNTVLHNPMLENEDIARIVRLSIGRVRNIFSTLYKKFSVRNRAELVTVAISRGYFIGLNLVFPRGLNVQPNQIKNVNGHCKYQIAL